MLCAIHDTHGSHQPADVLPLTHTVESSFRTPRCLLKDFIKELTGQSLGRKRFRRDSQTERMLGGGERRGESPGDMGRTLEEVQDRKEVTPHERTWIHINGLI